MRSSKSNAFQAGTAVLASALLMTSTLATEGPRYSYVEAGYVDLEVDNDSGFGGDLDGDGFALGGGINYAMSDTVDLVGRVSYLDAELGIDSFGSADESGNGLYAGARAMVSPAWEVNGGLLRR